MTSPMMRECAAAISSKQADNAVAKAQRELHRAAQSGVPQAVGRAFGRLQRAQELQGMVRARAGKPPPSLAPYDRVRVDAEAQRAAIEAAGTVVPLQEFPNAAVGRREAVTTPAQTAEQSVDGAPALAPARCRDHPSQVVDQSTGQCALCRMNPVRAWRAEQFADMNVPPTIRRL